MNKLFASVFLRRHFYLMLMCAALITFLTQPVYADPVFETNAIIDSSDDSLDQYDPKGPASSGTIESSVEGWDVGANPDTSGPASAAATANDAGQGAAYAEGVFWAGSDQETISAWASFTESFTNTTAAAMSFSYSYSLPNPKLLLADYCYIGETDDPTVTVEFEYELTVDFGGGPDTILSTNAQLVGGMASHSLTTGGTDPLAYTAFTTSSNIFGYDFSSLSGMLSSNADPGQTVIINSYFSTSVTGPGYETGGGAYFGDPLDLSANSFSGELTFGQTNAVPLPSALLLFGPGLAGLAGLKKKFFSET